MSGSFFSFTIESIKPDSAIVIAEAAFLAFVERELLNLADQRSPMAVYLLEYLQLPETIYSESNGSTVRVGLNGYSACANGASQATAHVMSELVCRFPDAVNQALERTGWRLSAEDDDRRFGRIYRFLMFRDAPSWVQNMGLATDQTGDVMYLRGNDGAFSGSFDNENEALSEYVTAPLEELQVCGDFENGSSEEVSELGADEQQTIVEFWQAGACRCPVCAANDPTFSATIGLDVAARFQAVVEAAGLTREFRLRFDRVDGSWRIMYVWPDDGNSVQWGRIPLINPAVAPTDQALVEALARVPIQPCRSCKAALIQPDSYQPGTTPKLRCPDCGADFAIAELLESS